jgi:hypothetical protein
MKDTVFKLDIERAGRVGDATHRTVEGTIEELRNHFGYDLDRFTNCSKKPRSIDTLIRKINEAYNKRQECCYGYTVVKEIKYEF